MEVSKFRNATDVGSEIRFPKFKDYGIGALDLSVPCVFGNFDWGPIDVPTEITSESELRDIFVGGDESWKQILTAFRNHSVKKMVVVRPAHYTDITDKTTLTALKSDYTIQNGTPVDVLTAAARYCGAYGDNIEVKITHSTKVSTTTTADLATGGTSVALSSSEDIEIGEILLIDDTTNSAYVKVTLIDGDTVHFAAVTPTPGSPIATGATVTSLNFDMEIYVDDVLLTNPYEYLSLETENKYYYIGNVIPTDSNHYINFTVEDLSSVSIEDRLPAAGTYQLAGGSDGTTILAADYMGDSTEKTGLYCLDLYGDGMLPVLFCVPEMVDADVHNAFIDYCEAKRIHFFIGDFAFDNDDSDCLTFLNTTAKINSEYCQYAYPALIYQDPDDANFTVTLKPSVSIAARMATTDQTDNGGPWQNSAGELYGGLYGVVALESVAYPTELEVITQNPDVRTALRKEKINPIYKKGTQFIIESAFTRAKGRDVQFVHINQIRTLQYVGASVDYSLSWVLMMNHDRLLETRVRTLIEEFVDGLPTGALYGATPADRRKIVCGPDNNPRNEDGTIVSPEDLYVSIYISTQTPVLRAYYDVYKKLMA
jgi:hypothetical protein